MQSSCLKTSAWWSRSSYFVENGYLSLRFPNMVKVNIHEHWTWVTRFNPLWVSDSVWYLFNSILPYSFNLKYIYIFLIWSLMSIQFIQPHYIQFERHTFIQFNHRQPRLFDSTHSTVPVKLQCLYAVTRRLKSFPWDALVYGSIMAFYLG